MLWGQLMDDNALDGEAAYRKAYHAAPHWLADLGFRKIWRDLPYPDGDPCLADPAEPPVSVYLANRCKSMSEQELLNHLYTALGFLDSKASGLLTANSLTVASMTFLMPAAVEANVEANNVLTFAEALARLLIVFAFFPLVGGVLMLLSVVNLRWTRNCELPGMNEAPAEAANVRIPWQLLAARAKRTILYRFAQKLTFWGYILVTLSFATMAAGPTWRALATVLQGMGRFLGQVMPCANAG